MADQIATVPQIGPHWLAMKEFDEEMYKRFSEYMQYVSKNEIIPPKYKELMMLAMCCVVRFDAGIRVHAKYALDKGATRDELLATAVQTLFVGGIPAYRDGILTIKEVVR
jgi:alkylhydroperoxidase/carboxymuconolactone decarboxylase family protein YurZ